MDAAVAGRLPAAVHGPGIPGATEDGRGGKAIVGIPGALPPCRVVAAPSRPHPPSLRPPSPHCQECMIKAQAFLATDPAFSQAFRELLQNGEMAVQQAIGRAAQGLGM